MNGPLGAFSGCTSCVAKHCAAPLLQWLAARQERHPYWRIAQMRFLRPCKCVCALRFLVRGWLNRIVFVFARIEPFSLCFFQWFFTYLWQRLILRFFFKLS